VEELLAANAAAVADLSERNASAKRKLDALLEAARHPLDLT
jgi:hypothetical protein